jgi:sortase A
MLDAIPSSTAAGAGRAVRQSGPRWPARLLRGFALLLILLGALTLIDGAVTLLWQEPITALLATLRQDHLSSALSKVEHAPPTAVEQRALAGLSDERQRIAYLADDFARRSGGGGAVGRITIPQIGASYVVVKGTGTEELKSGPGIDGRTHFPGVAGTTLIAGHRTTYLAPFRHIN